MVFRREATLYRLNLTQHEFAPFDFKKGETAYRLISQQEYALLFLQKEATRSVETKFMSIGVPTLVFLMGGNSVPTKFKSA